MVDIQETPCAASNRMRFLAFSRIVQQVRGIEHKWFDAFGVSQILVAHLIRIELLGPSPARARITRFFRGTTARSRSRR